MSKLIISALIAISTVTAFVAPAKAYTCRTDRTAGGWYQTVCQ